MSDEGGGADAVGGVEPALPEMPTATASPVRRSARRKVFAGVGVALVLGAGAVTTVVAVGGGGSGGAHTPEEAVQQLVEAVEAEDVLGVLDAIDPAERDALESAVHQVDTDAKRLDLLDSTFSLAGVAGLDVRFDGLALRTEEIDPDLAVVHATTGVVHATFDQAGFPFGDAVGDIGSEAVMDDIDLTEEGTDAFVATIKRGGSWYASASFTIAEYARRSADVQPAEPGRAVTPEGFDSPEAAAQALLDRAIGTDVRGMVATAAPGEGDALARYAPLFLPSATAGVQDAEAAGWTYAVEGPQWNVTRDGDRATAVLTRFTARGTLPDPFADSFSDFLPTAPSVIYLDDGQAIFIAAGSPVPDHVDDSMTRVDVGTLELPSDYNYAVARPDGTVDKYWNDASTAPSPFEIDYADGCATVSGSLLDWLPFLSLSPDGNQPSSPTTLCENDLSPLARLYPTIPGLLVDPPTIALVHVDGHWYVSPLGTVAATVAHDLHALGPDDLGIDGPLAFLLFSTSRSSLEDQLSGETREDVGDLCAAISEFDADGTFTKLIDHPSAPAVRACIRDYYGDGSGGDGGGATTTLPAASTTASATTAAGSDSGEYTEYTDEVTCSGEVTTMPPPEACSDDGGG